MHAREYSNIFEKNIAEEETNRLQKILIDAKKNTRTKKSTPVVHPRLQKERERF